MTCIWCNRKFHKQCLLKNDYDPQILFEKTSNIECTFCNPQFPIKVKNNIQTIGSKILTIERYGHYISPFLEYSKIQSDKKYLFPIGYRSSRMFPSYKTDQKTRIRCEIYCVDEKCLENESGEKDVFLFKVTFEDDPDNPIQVLNSPRYISTKIKERYSKHIMLPSSRTIFGLDDLYVQYLLHIHVKGAQEACTIDYNNILTEIANANKIDKVVKYQRRKKRVPSFLFSVNKEPGFNFDPQKELFNF